MAINDAFTAQIVQLVREMPDDAILALVRNQLGSFTAVATARTVAPSAAPRTPKARKVKITRAKAPKRASVKAAIAQVSVAAPAPAKAKAKAKSKKKVQTRKLKASKRAGGSAKLDALSLVEKIVKSSNGLAASQVAKAAGVPQSRAAAALKELKLGRRIFQGGDRRFARYAGDPRTAEAASMHARRTASGPAIEKGRSRR